MYPVVVSDLDGTLLNQHHELTPRTKEVIHRLSAEGIKFVFATGRHHLDVEKLRSQLGIEMFTITSNGARVHNPEGEAIICHDLVPEVVTSLVKISRKYTDLALANVYRDNEWYVEQENEELLQFNKDSGFGYIVQDLDTINTEAVTKIFFISHSGEHEDLVALEKEILETFGDQVSMAFSLPHCLEVMAPGVTKGRALEEVMKLKGLELKDAIAFGDGMNDLEMLSVAGKGLVMGNAHERLRSLLPEHEVIGECHDDAVAQYLENQYSN